MVYAIGIDGDGRARSMPTVRRGRPCGCRCRFRSPARRGGRAAGRRSSGRLDPRRREASASDRVNAVALRDLTDDSGGRTEIIREPRDLESGDRGHRQRIEPAVLSRLSGAREKDGRWHSIRVEVNNGAYRVRARRGYVAS